jgi:hypothetical protein
MLRRIRKDRRAGVCDECQWKPEKNSQRRHSPVAEILRDYTPKVWWADRARFDQDIVRTAWRHADLASRQGATSKVVSTLRVERK